MKKDRSAALFIIIAGICWGVIGLFSRYMAQCGMSPIQITFLRCAVAGIFVWAYIALTDRSKFKIKPRDIWMFIGTGIISVALFNIFYFTTMEETTLSAAAMLLYTAPCFVMLMSLIIFREKVTKAKIMALALAVLGCVFVTGVIGGMSISFYGLLTGLGSGVCYALYSIFGNIALKKYDTKTVTAYTFLFAAVALLPFCSVAEIPELIMVTDGLLLYVIAIGIVSTALPYLFYTAGLSRTEPGRASVMAFVEPMVATVTGAAVFAERLSVLSVLGIALIFLSILVLNKRNLKQKKVLG